jgi:radical SAM protein with 4Fe4S-binding SPASM domain
VDNEQLLLLCLHFGILNQKEWHIGNLRTKSINELLTSNNYKKIATSLNILRLKCNNCNKCQFWCAAIVDSTPNKISPFCLSNKNEK